MDNVSTTNVTNTISTNVTSTMSISSDDKKVRYKMDCYILHTFLLVTILLFMIAIKVLLNFVKRCCENFYPVDGRKHLQKSPQTTVHHISHSY